jgi:predicted ATPase
LDKDLDTLQAAGLIREAASVPEVEYIFRHDLTRDAAYDSLLFRRRRRFHRQVGEAMEDLFEGRLEEHAHRLAHHFHETADNDRALKYSAMAGDIAAGLYANDEAITHYARAIELAREAGPAELPRLLEALGDVKRSLGSASESSLLYEEASQLLSNKDDNSREVRVRGKAALSAITAGDLEKATSLLQATLETVSEDWSELAVAHTYYELSQLHWHSSRHGDALEAAQQSLEAALASGDVKEESHAYEAMALACHSLGDWQMGIEYELRRSALGDSGFDVDEAFDAHL